MLGSQIIYHFIWTCLYYILCIYTNNLFLIYNRKIVPEGGETPPCLWLMAWTRVFLSTFASCAETGIWFSFKLYISNCRTCWFEYGINRPKGGVGSRSWQEKPSYGPSSCSEGYGNQWQGNNSTLYSIPISSDSNSVDRFHCLNACCYWCLWTLRLTCYQFFAATSYLSICRDKEGRWFTWTLAV